MNKIVIIDEELCTGCGACVKMCPVNILYIDQESNACKVTDEKSCDKLRGCERICPVGAIKIN